MFRARWATTALIPLLAFGCGVPADDVTGNGPIIEETEDGATSDPGGGDSAASDPGGGNDAAVDEPETGGDGVSGLPPVAPLMRAGGWRDDLDADDWSYRYLEVAFDETAAQQAWDETTPDDLTVREGDPDEPGRYGSLDDVDFGRQAVVVWSSVAQATCPTWLTDVRTTGEGLEVREEEVADACDDEEYEHYRMILAVDRDRLPDAEDLPMMWVDGPPSTMAAAYPASETLTDASARAEALTSAPILDAGGELVVPVDRIASPIAEYTTAPPESLTELADAADAAVVGRATEREQYVSGPEGRGGIVMTRQNFEVVDTWWGDLGGDLTVGFSGGIVAQGSEVVLEEESVFPQFRPDREYLLFLQEPGQEVGHVWVHGQDEGRYLIGDGVPIGAGTMDLQSPNAQERPASDLVDTIVGRDLDELRRDLRDRRD